jgi:hypothetical protein
MAPPRTGSSLISHRPTEGQGSMKRITCSLLVATLPFDSVLADAPNEKNAKVTPVYQHELPNVPGKSIKGMLVECGPGGYSALTSAIRKVPTLAIETRLKSGFF